MPPLKDSQHEAFAQAVAEGMSQTQAYSKAGYPKHAGNASRLRSNEKVAARIDELKAKAAERAEISRESILKTFGRIADLALDAFEMQRHDGKPDPRLLEQAKGAMAEQARIAGLDKHVKAELIEPDKRMGVASTPLRLIGTSKVQKGAPN